jgi:sigma-B regulation protein RsbU (phosphoserine phosphatase)
MVVRYRNNGVMIERLTSGGTPLGMFPMAEYEEGSTVLQSDDILVCFSDGISEARNSKEELWDESEIEDLLRAASGASAREVAELLVRGADEFTGEAEQADDMTVVTLRAV